jgi:uncharacterized protein (DUF302 family)
MNKKISHLLSLLLLLSVTLPVTAADMSPQVNSKHEPSVYVREIKREAGKVYSELFSALENNGYFVVFETNIGKSLSHFAQRWGEDYNRNKLESIRSMIFCNGWYANQVSNADPHMLALCPMHVTITQKQGITSILYLRPSQVAKNSPASKIATEMEQDVVRVINSIQ